LPISDGKPTSSKDNYYPEILLNVFFQKLQEDFQEQYLVTKLSIGKYEENLRVVTIVIAQACR
jgi:hypothetical protein